jgi:16S rRNA processing protein RimM
MLKAGLENLKDGQYLLLGKVARPFGIRGEVRVHPYNPFSENFEYVKSLFLREPSGKTSEFKIENIRPHQNFYLVQFEGVKDRDRAEALRDWEVLVKKDQLKPPKDGEYYWHDLIGLLVVEEGGKEVGRVSAIEETNPHLGGNDILVVSATGAECREVLVPFTKKNIQKVDLAAGKIIISGLEELKA